MNSATSSPTPPSTVMAIMPTRNFPPGAISDAGDACPNATPDRLANNAIEKKIRRICLLHEKLILPYRFVGLQIEPLSYDLYRLSRQRVRCYACWSSGHAVGDAWAAGDARGR